MEPFWNLASSYTDIRFDMATCTTPNCGGPVGFKLVKKDGKKVRVYNKLCPECYAKQFASKSEK